MPKKTRRAFTHAIGLENTDEHGTKRNLAVMLCEDGTHQIAFTTHWAGRKKPLVTRLSLSDVAVGMLTSTLTELHTDLAKWAVTVAQSQAAPPQIQKQKKKK